MRILTFFSHGLMTNPTLFEIQPGFIARKAEPYICQLVLTVIEILTPVPLLWELWQHESDRVNATISEDDLAQ